MYRQTSAQYHGGVDKQATYDNIRASDVILHCVSRLQWRLSRIGDAYLHQPRQRAIPVHPNQRRLGEGRYTDFV